MVLNKMVDGKFYVRVAVIFLLPILHARHLPENINLAIIPDNEHFLPEFRQQRQNSGVNYHAPHQQTSSIFNLLNTHGIGISASIGAGFRYANADSHQSDHPDYTPAPSTSSVWDRYLGSTWHVGINTHLGNNKQGHEGVIQQAGGGALPIVEPPPQDGEERSDIGTTTNVPQTDSFWDRLSKYFAWNRIVPRRCDTTTEDEQVNCQNPYTNVFTKLFTRYLVRESPRSETRSLTDDNFFIRLNSLMEYAWKDKTDQAGQMASVRNDYDVFRNTIKYFLIERFTSFVTQNTTNEQLLRKMVRNSLLQIMNERESYGTAKTDKELLLHLSRYYTNDRIKEQFPDIELLRNKLSGSKIETENDYNSWFRDNFSIIVGKYYLNSYNAVPLESSVEA